MALLGSARVTWLGTIIVSIRVTSVFLTFLFDPLWSLGRLWPADSLIFLWVRTCADAAFVSRSVTKEGVDMKAISKFGGMLAQSGIRVIRLWRFADF